MKARVKVPKITVEVTVFEPNKNIEDFKDAQGRPCIRYRKIGKPLNPGDYIIKRKDGTKDAMSKQLFDKHYEIVDDDSNNKDAQDGEQAAAGKADSTEGMQTVDGLIETLEAMTKAELVDYAEKNNIELPENANKAKIFETIKTALEANSD